MTNLIGWYDIPAASEYCSTGKRTVEMWLKEKGLRYSRVRGKRLIRREWIDNFLEKHEVGNGNEVAGIVNEVLRDLQ